MSQVGPQSNSEAEVSSSRIFSNISRRTLVISVCVVLVIAAAIALSAVFVPGLLTSASEGEWKSAQFASLSNAFAGTDTQNRHKFAREFHVESPGKSLEKLVFSSQVLLYRPTDQHTSGEELITGESFFLMRTLNSSQLP